MLVMGYFLVAPNFVENSDHEKYFWDAIRKSSDRKHEINQNLLVIHSELQLADIYKNCEQKLEEKEYLFICPFGLHYLPKDSDLQAFLYGID